LRVAREQHQRQRARIHRKTTPKQQKNIPNLMENNEIYEKGLPGASQDPLGGPWGENVDF
jgi:hypothetical protein